MSTSTCGCAVAISSNMHQSVHCVDTRGRLKHTYRAAGVMQASDDPMHRLWGFAFDTRGSLLISDHVSNKIVVLSNTGNVLGHIDLTEHQLRCPRGVAMENDGTLLVLCQPLGGDCRFMNCVVRFHYTID